MWIDAPESVVNAIAEALIGDDLRLARSVAVVVPPARRNDRGWPQLIVAAVVTERGTSDEDADGPVAAWATSGKGGPCFAVNGAAREHTTWGAAARGGSPMDAKIDHVRDMPEVEAAVQLAAARPR